MCRAYRDHLMTESEADELIRALTTPGSRIRLYMDKSISIAVGSMDEADLVPLKMEIIPLTYPTQEPNMPADRLVLKEEVITPEMELAGYQAYLDWSGPDWQTPTELVRAVYVAMRAACK